VAQSSKVIEVLGARYLVTRFVGQTYSVRSTPNGEVIGVFALDETEARVVGVEGGDVPLTLDVARAMLRASQDTLPELPRERWLDRVVARGWRRM
jgi:hypothetical protein